MEDIEPGDDLKEATDVLLITDCSRNLLKLNGLGYIIFPSDQTVKSFSDQIEVYIDNPDKYSPHDLLKNAHKLLSLVGCPPVLVESRQIDIE
jgi:hypothetical protein